MSLDPQVKQTIENHLDQHRVVLFMKGTPEQPMCGFSSQTASILDSLVPGYHSVNVLADEEIREGIKVFGDWPTIPQLYIDNELIGGSDIVTSMFNSGELHPLLGLDSPDRTPPEITITDAAAEQIRASLEAHPELAVHLTVDGNWQPRFQLGPRAGHEIETESNGITVLVDLATAERASGAHIDWVETLHGQGLKVDLPAAPAAVQQVSVEELKQKLDEDDEVILIDVRPDEARAAKPFEPARAIDGETAQWLESLPKDTPLYFICEHGNSSLAAGEHFRRLGFSETYSVTGGIQTWNERIGAN